MREARTARCSHIERFEKKMSECRVMINEHTQQIKNKMKLHILGVWQNADYIHSQGPHYTSNTTKMMPPKTLPPNMAADSLCAEIVRV